MLIAELLDPKLDYVFKRIFGHVGNEYITKGLLEAITNEKIKYITLDHNPITEKDLLEVKVGILDIKAVLNNNTNCDIEMQVADRKHIEKRLLFYWSKMYASSINKGKKYKNLKKAVVILLTNYNLKRLREINKYLTKWKIIEDYERKIVLTDDLEIYIIELPKVNIHNSKTILDNWLNFIINPKEDVSMKNKELQEAKKVLEEISQDEHERYLAELREKYIMDQYDIEEAGYDKGLEAGIEQGIEQNKKKTAQKLLSKGLSIEEISEITELTKEQIEELTKTQQQQQ